MLTSVQYTGRVFSLFYELTTVQPLAAAPVADPAELVAHAVQCLVQDSACIVAVVEQVMSEETAQTVQMGTAEVSLNKS